MPHTSVAEATLGIMLISMLITSIPSGRLGSVEMSSTKASLVQENKPCSLVLLHWVKNKRCHVSELFVKDRILNINILPLFWLKYGL